MGLLTAKVFVKFEPKKLTQRMDKKEKRVLFRSAAFARTTMMRGQRRRKKASKEGDYPSAHSGELKKLIRFDVDVNAGTAAVGPVAFKSKTTDKISGAQTVPELINAGGQVATVVRGKPVIQNYAARPFVTLSLDVAADNMAKLMESVPF